MQFIIYIILFDYREKFYKVGVFIIIVYMKKMRYEEFNNVFMFI